MVIAGPTALGPSLSSVIASLLPWCSSPVASSPVLSSFWSQQSSLYGFLLVSLPLMSSSAKSAPDFPRASVMDIGLKPGHYYVSGHGLAFYSQGDKAWESILDFPDDDLADLPLSLSTRAFFKLV